MCQAVCTAPAPSMRAASMTSGLMLLSAPYMMTIQPPAPVQKAMTVKIDRQVADGDDVCTKRLEAHARAAGPRPG